MCCPQQTPGLGHRAPPWIVALIQEILNDADADARSVALATWVKQELDPEHG